MRPCAVRLDDLTAAAGTYERRDDGAMRFPIADLAVVQKVGKRFFHPLQVDDPFAYLFQALRGDSADASPIRPVFQGEKLSDFVERKAELLGAPDESDTLNVRMAVSAVSTRSRRGLRNEPPAFVITHGLNPDLSRFGRTCNRQRCIFHGNPLTPYQGTDCRLRPSV